MEESRYWMWTKQKNGLSSHILATSTNLSSTYGDSWKEQAFAQDAAGPLGGCIWPPRSYTCSFCKREFKSAQALGGHMNVHRRDRARLKQLSPNDHLSDPATTSSGIQYSSQRHNVVFDQNPSYEFLTSQPPSTLRVSFTISEVVNWHEELALSSSPPFSSKTFEEQQRNILEFSPPLNSNVVANEKYCYAISDEKKEEKNINFLEPKYRTKKRDYDAADLSVNLNCVASRYNHELNTTSSDEDDNMSCKQRRTTFDDHDDDATVPFFPKQSLIDGKGVGHDSQVEVVEVISPNLKEDLDLELRLGVTPQVPHRLVE